MRTVASQWLVMVVIPTMERKTVFSVVLVVTVIMSPLIDTTGRDTNRNASNR
jgi:hypothetical protein